HCPDICPATLFQLKGLRAQLQSLDKDSQPRIWLVSVDPARDTPETLNRYLAHFGEGFTGITGNDDEIARLAASLGVAYQRIDEGEDYTMSHSAALFVLDPQGHFVALFSAPHEMTAIADDYRLLSR
ncbi:MAG: SCO family protein, partial [Gammaproteobacteria bacterium]|nr:SCO family protein [Gammaproteobacteria bacterium]